MPLNEAKLHQTNGHARPELKRPNPPKSETSTDQPQERTIRQVQSASAFTTATTATDRIQAMQSYVENFNTAVGQQVDQAAFAMAATIATIPAQLANRTLFYLEKMGGNEAWSQFDRALSEVSRTPAEQLLFDSDVFELPQTDRLFED